MINLVMQATLLEPSCMYVSRFILFAFSILFLSFCCQGLKDTASMCTVYREVLHQDNINIEASACLATNFFYNDQPEVALQYYR